MAHRFRCRLEGCGPRQPRCAGVNSVSRRRRSGRPPGDRPAMAHPLRWRPGGLRSLAAAVRRYQQRFTAPTDRTYSRESASNGPSVSVQAWRAAVPGSRGAPVSIPFHGADGADALQGIGQQWPIRCGGGLEGSGPSQPLAAENWHHFTAPTERTPSRDRPATAHRFRCRPGELRSLAAAVRRYPQRFTGPRSHSRSGSYRKAIESRFHELMLITARLRSTSSCSEKTRTASA
jgi:hypothetical protein